jgi:hypothetical protein
VPASDADLRVLLHVQLRPFVREAAVYCKLHRAPKWSLTIQFVSTTLTTNQPSS